jgi:hypothetical protein
MTNTDIKKCVKIGLLIKIAFPAVFLGTCFILLGVGCAPLPVNQAAFSGHWEQTTENGITGQVDKESWDVQVEGDKYHMIDRLGTMENHYAYDGKEFRHSGSPTLTQIADAIGIPALKNAVAQMNPPPTPEATHMAAQLHCFWLQRKQGEKSAGGTLCGRETILYDATEKRPDGEIHQQVWFDKENDIVLKRVYTIYSSQIQSMVSKTTLECQSLQIQHPDPAVFSQP